MNTNNLSIPFVVQSQAQKEVTINQAIAMLEVLQNRGVADKDLATPPGSPVEGEAYIIASSPTGAWSGKAQNIAYFNGGWKFIAPNEGLIVWVNDEDKIYVYNGSSWVSVGGELQNLAMVGINATADSTNKLSVASESVLFNHNGADIRTKLSKNSTSDTASFLFQNNFSGRTEFGLIGDDDFTLKTSTDGSSWNNSFKASKTDGCVDFLAGIKFNSGSKLSTYVEGTWTPTLRGSSTAGTNTYIAQSGRYVKIGKYIYASGRVAINGAVDSAMVGTMQISGLPFNTINATDSWSAYNFARILNINLTPGTQLAAQVAGNTTVANLVERAATGDTAITSTSKFGSNFEIRFSLNYEATS